MATAHGKLVPVNELEQLIAIKGDQADAEPQVRRRLLEGSVLALGQGGGDGEALGLLEFDAPGPDGLCTYVPVFTSRRLLGTALIKQPEWGDLAVFKVRGTELLANLAATVIVVLNPWSPLEFKLPLSADGGAEQAET